jgi:enoyl-CoA hydratase/carnithine racemase
MPSLIDSQAVLVSQIAPGYLKVVLDNPPINLIDSRVFAGLLGLQDYVQDQNHGVKVVVLESANPDFFVAHLDLGPMMAGDPAGMRSLKEHWPGFSTWLHSSRAVTVAKVRGRARGIGNELVIACDLRFASREKTRLCQVEVGFGEVPGGGGLEWLPRLLGRSRALEVILGADDFDADTAERYGWINRSLPDGDLDSYVDRIARRIASFDATAIATAKSLVDQRLQPPTEAELKESLDTILRLAAGDASRRIRTRLVAKAGGSLAPRELDLPDLYGPAEA